ncbi:MFS general substrate transporter [Exidia glandulosa HHB12029]|uniref:MFS general substrate transporter n=1 Tax=Exidia glandulosa HHB12029 TaxID=1314781 RepID=A0A165I404_EXIGL|nr:MFS general substrate transporter [Exidia glandulosa HHB12029]
MVSSSRASEERDVVGQDGEPDALLSPDWTRDEEARAKRKVDFIVLPLLMLGFFCLQLDRGNIANALTDNFLKDIGITQNQFNVGQQLLSTGIVLLEIPSNILLYRIGPQKWLSLQVVAFGLVSTFQAFQKGYGAFLATRLLLGLTESGFIPGGLYTLTTWYTRAETAKRVMVFFVGNLAASASTNLIAYGILHMRGVADKPGWFWLFVTMGLFSILAGLVLALLLPDSVHKPTPFLLPRLRLFTERELYILKHRVILDDPAKASGPVRIGRKDLVSALSNWKLYPHVMITLCNNGPLTAFNTYTPTIINTFGFDRLRSNALASVGPWTLIPIAILLSWLSDQFQLRAAMTTLALTVNWVFMIVNQQLTYSNSRGKRYAGVVLTQSINFTPHPLNIAWMTLHCHNSTERAVAMAMIIMAANAAGIYGSQLLRSDDAPRYHRGFIVMVVLLSAGVAFCLFQWAADKVAARRASTTIEDPQGAGRHDRLSGADEKHSSIASVE